MTARYLSVLLMLITCRSHVTSSPQCRNERGEPVDWYVLYKLPKLATSKEYLIRKGLAYMYVTSSNATAEWTLSNVSINDTSSMPAKTLAPLYGKKLTNTMIAMYNDDPPSSSASLIYGHTKGVVIAESDGGLWLVHSVPNFPPPANVTHKYGYPSNAVRFGQSFLCISLPAGQLNAVGGQLMYYRPKVYATSMPTNLQRQYPNLTLAAQGKFVRSAPWSSKTTIKSLAGVSFISYAKSSKFEKDLYAGWLAEDLQTNLQVETWSNGAGEMPSDCRSKFHVMDVTNVAVKLNKTVSVEFKNSQDHSKWAVTVGGSDQIVCIGDINRMTAQLKRGGGTVCVRHSGLWKRYSKSVVDVQPCPSS